jgi:hypothetical protein
VIVLIGFGGLMDADSRVHGMLFLVVGIGSLCRAVTSSNVLLHESGVVTRSMLRTRRHLFRDLIRVEVAVGQTGLNGFDREHLVFHRVDGTSVSFKELNCRPSAGESSVVRRAARCIQQRISAEP